MCERSRAIHVSVLVAPLRDALSLGDHGNHAYSSSSSSSSPHPVPSVDFAAILRQKFDMVGELCGVDQLIVSRTLQSVTDALLQRES